MGLDISSQSQYRYHAGYSGIHLLRYEAYKSYGGEKDFPGWMSMQNTNTHEQDKAFMKTVQMYPNLVWHSDCDGGYTTDSKSIDYFEQGEIDPL